MIPFNVPTKIGNEEEVIAELLKNQPLQLCGGGTYSKKCQQFIKEQLGCSNVLLTTSCTAALEMAMILCDIGHGDEVIIPSFTFPSTANAVVLRGAIPVFVDIDPQTCNIDPACIEAAITEKTKAMIIVHYAGVSCDMDRIKSLAEKYRLYIVEDAAHAIGATYHLQHLGTIGDLGAFSFHDTKNITCGEGGALLVNNPKLVERAEIVHDKGTNRKLFFRNQIDKYSWVDMGSSYLLSELNAAFLYGQLQNLSTVNNQRMKIWNHYYRRLSGYGAFTLPSIPSYAQHNAHLFYIKLDSLEVRNELMSYLKEKGIATFFHYVPLHSAKAGMQYGRFHGVDRHTTSESLKLLRLPMYSQLSLQEVDFICDEMIKWVKNVH